jgi:putative NADH-flavin reductase
MKITIIGASAGIGLATVQQALAKGHMVTALSRSTAGIPDHPALTKINGSATSLKDMKMVIADADAVIMAIGTKNKKPNTLFSDAGKVLVEAGTALKLQAPVLIISGFGAGDSSGFLGLFMRTIIRLFLKHQYIDKTKMEEIITASNLNWVIVRPGMLTDGPRTQRYKVLPKLYKGIKISRISRADVADFLMQEAESPTLIQKFPALTS